MEMKKTLVLSGAAGGGAGGLGSEPPVRPDPQASFPPARAWSHIAAMYPVRLFARALRGTGARGRRWGRARRRNAGQGRRPWACPCRGRRSITASSPLAPMPGRALAGWAGGHDGHAAGGGGEGVGAGVVGLPFGGGKEVHHSTLTESINQSIAVMQSHWRRSCQKSRWHESRHARSPTVER